MTYKTCNHLYDTGGTCNSAAVSGRDYCVNHLRHCARRMRIAKYRARHERFDLNLPPLEDMYAVQSALNQLVEAVAADMIDLKRAPFLLSALRTAGQFLRHADQWTASPYHTDQPAPAIDLAAEYGLPADLDLEARPEVVFPQLQEGLGGCSTPPSFGGVGLETDNRQPTTDHSFSEMPFSGDYCGDHHSRECECCRIRADHPLTPEDVEIVEISQTLGSDAAALRGKQLERNRQRRQVRSNCKRYAAIALEKNMRRAPDIIAQRKLAERAAAKEQEKDSEVAKKPPASAACDNLAEKENEDAIA